MPELPLWKRLPIVVVLLVVSAWLTAKALQTIVVACAPDADGNVSCRYERRYAAITWREEMFKPTPERVTSRRVGKNYLEGEIYIQLETGEKLTIDWLSAEEAEAAAAQLVRDPLFRLEAKGSRWWLLYLLITIPVAVVLVRPRRSAAAHVEEAAPPGVPSKKARRAERGRQRKAADQQRR